MSAILYTQIFNMWYSYDKYLYNIWGGVGGTAFSPKLNPKRAYSYIYGVKVSENHALSKVYKWPTLGCLIVGGV